MHTMDQLFTVDLEAGTLGCATADGTRLCVTVSGDSLRNVSMQPCSTRVSFSLEPVDEEYSAGSAV